MIILDVIWGCARYAVGIALRGEVANEFLGSSAARGSVDIGVFPQELRTGEVESLEIFGRAWTVVATLP